MKMRPLIITPETKKEAQALMAHARQNIYRVGATKIPGDDPKFVLHIQVGFRCVFTYTAAPSGSLYRHLTVSVDGEKYPSPEAMTLIAKMFEFSPGMGEFDIPKTWQFDMNQRDHCITLVEELK